MSARSTAQRNYWDKQYYPDDESINMSYERKNIQAMTAYVSGEQPDAQDVIKLNTNENPYPPSAKIQQLTANFNIDSLRRYPPPTANRFRDIAATIHKVGRGNIIATRGGDELLRLLITTFVDPRETIGMTDPTYSLYPVLAQIQDCKVFKVPLNEDWSLPQDFAKQINAAGCKLTLLVNPHAPSGQLLNTRQLSVIADELNSVLLIDEAYVDFVVDDYDAIPLIFKHDNVVILRTLSKGYSLAGLRFGYGIGPESIITPMVDKTRDSYNLDLLCQQIAEAALFDRSHALKNCQLVIEQRGRMEAAFSEHGFEALKSQANFLLLTVTNELQNRSGKTAEDIYQALKIRNILVRYFPEERLQNKLRITIGTKDENSAILEALGTILA
ncbi:MAG: histidinol-phosphate transaminase [Pseudomonadales bacterium]